MTRADLSAAPDDRLRATLAPMMQTALRRQLWLFFLDGDDAAVGPVMPCADHPGDPSEPGVVDDLGPIAAGDLFGARFAGLVAMFESAYACRGIALVWERLGDANIDDETDAWAKALGSSLADHGVRVRAQMLLHDRGLRVLRGDDLV